MCSTDRAACQVLTSTDPLRAQELDEMSPPFVKCPTCRREIDWAAARFRPFCSERCRLIDLGAWLSERHAIPGETAEEEEAANKQDPPSTRNPD